MSHNEVNMAEKGDMSDFVDEDQNINNVDLVSQILFQKLALEFCVKYA